MQLCISWDCSVCVVTLQSWIYTAVPRQPICLHALAVQPGLGASIGNLTAPCVRDAPDGVSDEFLLAVVVTEYLLQKNFDGAEALFASVCRWAVTRAEIVLLRGDHAITTARNGSGRSPCLLLNARAGGIACRCVSKVHWRSVQISTIGRKDA